MKYLFLCVVALSGLGISASADSKVPSESKIHRESKDRRETSGSIMVTLKPEEGAFIATGGDQGQYSTSPSSPKIFMVIEPNSSAQYVSVPLPKANTAAAGSPSEGSIQEVQVMKFHGWLVQFPQIGQGGKATAPSIKQHAKKVLQFVQAVTSGRQVRMPRVFTTAIAGARLDGVTERDLQQLVKAGLIMGYQPNFAVSSLLQQSVPLIEAPKVWQEFGTKGKGVRIGIIDSGVDYTHESFGACTRDQFLAGQCAKVQGGYDFIDDDNDADDCVGHGTHVASIAAGAGVLPGVAPEATVVPIRVIDCDNLGYSDGILAGIEWALDPNQDGDTSDHLEVINLSLGGPGNPDDLLSQAIDEAANIGTIAAIAAGNGGRVVSPGTSRLGITVGAINRDKNLASFSSWGPVQWQDADGVSRMLLKPDLVAPGNPVCAAYYPPSNRGANCFDDAHIELSGTSMAAPHVAGSAALLRAVHADWSVAQVKAALLGSAQMLRDYPPHTAGRGLLNVWQAASKSAPIAVRIDALQTLRHMTETVSGTISTPSQVQLEVAYVAYPTAGIPTDDQFTTISSASYQAGESRFEAKIDTGRLPKLSLIRVRATNDAGISYDDYAFGVTDLFRLRSPYSSQTLNPHNTVDFLVDRPQDAGISDVQLSYRRTDDFFHSINVPSTFDDSADDFVKVSVEPDQFPARGEVSVTIKIIYKGGRSTLKQTLLFDESLLPGFSVQIPLSVVQERFGYGVWDPGPMKPLVGNLVGDSAPEIAIYRGGYPARVFIFDNKGNLLNDFGVGEGMHAFPSLSYSPALADMDGDGFMELVLFSSIDGRDSSLLHVLRADGSELSNWPQTVGDSNEGPQGPSGIVGLSVERLPGIEKPVIFASMQSGTKTLIFDSEGNILNTLKSGNNECEISPNKYRILWAPANLSVVSDLTNRCSTSIISYSQFLSCNDKGPEAFDRAVTIFDAKARKLRSWNVSQVDISESGNFFDNALTSNPLVADLNVDGKQEIVVADTRHFPSESSLYLFNHNGELRPGWPISVGLGVASDPIPIKFNPRGQWQIGLGALKLLDNSDRVLTGVYKTFDLSGKLQLSLEYDPIYGRTVQGRGSLASLALADKKGRLIVPDHSISAYDQKGTLEEGFPKMASSTQVVLTDLDQDGALDLVANGQPRTYSDGAVTTLSVFNTGWKAETSTIQWGEYRHDSNLSGVVPLPPRDHCWQVTKAPEE